MARKKNDIVMDGQLCFNLSTNTSNYVVQSNALVLAKQSLKLNSAKIMRVLIMQIQPHDDDFKTYQITITELAKLLGVARSNLYRDIDGITDELMKSQIVLRPSDYDVSRKNEKRFVKLQWVDACGYDDELGLAIKINPILKPYLLNLKERYTQYPLEDILSMKSSYAIRIYELIQEEQIMKYLPRNGAYVELSIQDIRHACDCEDKYPLFANFRERVIDVAVREIGECTNYVVTYEPIKKNGSTYDTIRFHINMFYH